MQAGSLKGQVSGNCNAASTALWQEKAGEKLPRELRARAGPGDTLAPEASDGGDSRAPSQHAGVCGNAVCKYTALTAAGALGPGLLHGSSRRRLLAGSGESGGWGQREDEDAAGYPLGSSPPARWSFTT